MIRWDELGSLIERLTVYLHLPSGVKQGQYKVEVVDEGATREMQIDWLESMTNSALMFRKWSRQPKNHENFTPLSHVEFLANGEGAAETSLKRERECLLNFPD